MVRKGKNLPILSNNTIVPKEYFKLNLKVENPRFSFQAFISNITNSVLLENLGITITRQFDDLFFDSNSQQSKNLDGFTHNTTHKYTCYIGLLGLQMVGDFLRVLKDERSDMYCSTVNINES